jgi:RNA polymerase sigma-70 factor, ECF subfamily
VRLGGAMKPDLKDVTLLLQRMDAGDNAAADQLVPLLYQELRRMAGAYLRHERPDHTLQPTALVNEAYLKLVDQKNVQWQNRSHFFGVASQLMRRILVDYARGHQAAKRGGGAGKLSLDEAMIASPQNAGSVLALDETLSRLSEVDPQLVRVVEMRVFGGLSIEETSAALGVSPATVKRNWSMAKAWLTREMGKKKD